jgi:hypothetical protein
MMTHLGIPLGKTTPTWPVIPSKLYKVNVYSNVHESNWRSYHHEDHHGCFLLLLFNISSMTPVPPTRHSYNHTRQAVKEKNLGLRAALASLKVPSIPFTSLECTKKQLPHQVHIVILLIRLADEGMDQDHII